MKISIIADVLGSENNGTTITVRRLINNLKKRGHDVKVVSPSKIDEEGYYSVDTIDFKIFNNYVAENGVELAKADKEILKKVIDDSDVVHILLPFSLGTAALKICLETSTPFTTAFHAQPENLSCHVGLEKNRTVNRAIYKFFNSHFYKYAPYIHCPTEFIAEKLRENGYVSDFRVISNGVDPVFVPRDVPKPQGFEDKFLILNTARICKEKSQADIIKAISKSKYSDKIQLFIAGDGPLKNKIEKMGAKLKNPPIIAFHPKEELCNLINSCDLFVCSSYAEIESIACLEAISCGLVPIIANSPMSAARFFALTENNSYNYGDTDDLAAKIDFMIEHPDLRLELKKRYIEYSERFRIEKCIDKMEEMFSDAVNGIHK